MYTIGLDMARNTCGIAIYGHKKLLYDSLILTAKEKKELNTVGRISRMMKWVDESINGYYNKPHELIIEDIFYGKNIEAFKNVAKMQGAYLYHYYSLTGKKPTFIMAISARKNLSLRTRASKAEIQLWVLEQLNLGKISKEITNAANINLQAYQQKELSAKTFKNKMNKLSTQITKETGLDEHMADAIILTL